MPRARTDLPALGQTLREARKSKGLSQTELAALLGVGQTTLSSWETGESAIPVADLKRLAIALGISRKRWGDLLDMAGEEQADEVAA